MAKLCIGYIGEIGRFPDFLCKCKRNLVKVQDLTFSQAQLPRSKEAETDHGYQKIRYRRETLVYQTESSVVAA